jgi:pimeloyl-ACP methyl ester carboxylesterase/putative sterol carrier protein
MAAAGVVSVSLSSLSDRYKGDPSGKLHARFRLRIGKTVRDVVVTPDSCKVGRPDHSKTPDAEIRTTPETWLEIDAGRLSGIEAFANGDLNVRGSIQRSLLFEPLFERPDAGGMRYTIERVVVDGKIGISTFVAGPEDAPPLLLIHGLGATKASWLTVVPQMAQRFRVYVVDLPGFGSSSKPRGRYDAAWFAGHMFSFLDALDIDRIHIGGNSMGGRIAQEMALMHPRRVESIACLCPATAFSQRPGLFLARVLRPELGFAVGKLPRKRLLEGMQEMFADHRRVDRSWYEAAIDDFLRTWKGVRARIAFFAAARRIYLEEPEGESGFWSRVKVLESRSFYIFGKQDRIISPHFSRKVQTALPSARVEVWDDCGHVPQVEYPDRTAQVLLEFFSAKTSKARRVRSA